MDMKVYIADRKSGKQLYKRTKKLYKRYKYGTLIMTGILLIMIVLDLWMIWRTEDRSHLGGTLILCFGADILFIIAAVLARAAAISGGREVLMSRLAEKCFFTDDSFVLEYIPNPHETTAYECIRFQMKHRIGLTSAVLLWKKEFSSRRRGMTRPRRFMKCIITMRSRLPG